MTCTSRRPGALRMTWIRIRRHGFQKPPQPNGLMPSRPRSEWRPRIVRHAARVLLVGSLSRLACTKSRRRCFPRRGHQLLLSRRGWLVASPILLSEANDDYIANTPRGRKIAYHVKMKKKDVLLWTCRWLRKDKGGRTRSLVNLTR